MRRNSTIFTAVFVATFSILGCNRDERVSIARAKAMIIEHELPKWRIVGRNPLYEVKELPINNLWQNVHAQLFLCWSRNGVGSSDGVYYIVYKQKLFLFMMYPLYSIAVDNDSIYYTTVANQSGAAGLGRAYFENDTLTFGNRIVIYNYNLFVKTCDWGIGVESGNAQRVVNYWTNGELVGKITKVGCKIYFIKCENFPVHLDPTISDNSTEYWIHDLTPCAQMAK